MAQPLPTRPSIPAANAHSIVAAETSNAAAPEGSRGRAASVLCATTCPHDGQITPNAALRKGRSANTLTCHLASGRPRNWLRWEQIRAHTGWWDSTSKGRGSQSKEATMARIRLKSITTLFVAGAAAAGIAAAPIAVAAPASAQPAGIAPAPLDHGWGCDCRGWGWGGDDQGGWGGGWWWPHWGGGGDWRGGNWGWHGGGD